MALFWPTVIVIVAALSPSSESYLEEECYARNSDPYLFFATKTAYSYVAERRGKEADVPAWAVKLCEEDQNNLRSWQWNATFSVRNASRLSEQGRSDMRSLAQRTKSRFRSIFNQPYSRERFIFKSTEKERAHESAREFVRTLFNEAPEDVIPTPLPNPDPLLQFYDACPPYENKTLSPEPERFLRGEEMNNVVLRVGRRLGFPYNITVENVKTLHRVCSFQKALKYAELSPWCAVFSKEDLEILEYYGDLKSYYEFGFGDSINSKVACPLVTDMLDRFSKLEKESIADSPHPPQPVGAFYFAHSATLRLVQTRLGIGKVERHLTADAYSESTGRAYRMSKLSPFAGNLAAVLYRCNSEPRLKVSFFINEHLYHYQHEACQVGLCDWLKIKAMLLNMSADCGSKYVCTYKGGSSALSSSIALTIVLVFTSLSAFSQL